MLDSLDLSTKAIRKARRCAMKARTTAHCVACRAYGNRCSDSRPCSRCKKLSRECVPLNVKNMQGESIHVVQSMKDSETHKLRREMSSKHGYRSQWAHLKFDTGFSDSGRPFYPRRPNQREFSRDTTVQQSSDRISIYHLVHHDI